ncbi:HPF/RaiA family ribosome-associated protein [Actinokineospora sp. NBRC 105648]|uniref:HPF/RaiA family ribosome-associated protein n=1 Tax=Actinokineospora sp. NBRC 105648 TaxID=3032206 RepID=UPI0025527E70|nr:HPF/RaiA family ribosome-associated protein [Actinokineospora sp. NBRC 105648]
MQILVNTDHNIHGSAKLVEHVEAEVSSALERFGDRLTRVEVHLSDENADREVGEDKRCVMEARGAGAAPVAVTHHAGSVEDAFTGAAHKLAHLLDSKFTKAANHKGAETIRRMAADTGLV